jgi:methyltransferase (TIGR00027 family)
VEGKPSRTAVMAAVTRGRHRLEDDRPWVLDDPFALVLVGPRWREIAERSAGRLDPRVLRTVRASIVVRSRYAEDRLESGEFGQYVVLGAGLDSFAWRRPDVVRRLRVYEVDHPLSQAWKLDRVDALGLPRSDRHVFAPVDFERQSLREGLHAAGFDWSVPTFWSWLGVTMYLTEEAISATLRAIAAGAPGSEVVFSYSEDREPEDAASADLRDGLARVVAEQGEPFVSRFTPGQAAALADGAGLVVADSPTRDRIHERYLAGRVDGLAAAGGERLLAAVRSR